MNSVIICNRTGGKCSRVKIESVDFKENVSALRRKAANAIEFPEHKIELIYAGCSLKDEREISSYGVKPGVTIHALKKVQSDELEKVTERPSSGEVEQAVTALQTALGNPAYRTTVEKMLTDDQTIDNLTATVPGLSSDPVAMAMLQSPELLGILSDPDHIDKVIGKHPLLGQAAMALAAAVREEAARSGASGSSRSARGTYSLDQMSDDEDDLGQPSGGSRRRGPRQQITASQLAAAISMATGLPGQPTSGGGGGQSSSQGTSGEQSSSGISADFFQQALLQAQGGGGGSGASSQTPPSQPVRASEEQLQQLRDMGITDEAVARQALEATGGDIQAALELIFGEGMQ